MKRVCVLLLAFSLVFALCGCGETNPQNKEEAFNEKTDAVKNVERLIDGIGEVSIEKEKYIIDAEKAYEELYEIDKNAVDNYDILLSAREEYDKLVDEKIEKNTTTINQAKSLAAELRVVEALELLENAEAETTIDEVLSQIANAKQEISSMLYDGTAFVKLEYVLPLYSKNTTITSIREVDGWWQYQSNDMVSAYLIYENQYLCHFTVKEVVKDKNGYIDYTTFTTEDGQVLIEKLDRLDFIYISTR